MNYDQHLARYLGKYLADYGGQCVSNAAHYCLDNSKPIAYANACDWWNHPSLTGAFSFVANNPNDYNQVPARGNILIWNSALAGSGGAGHIAIFDHIVSPGVFTSCDANWGGATVHMVTHNWNNIIGWMVPKVSAPAPAPAQGEEMIADINQAKLAYRLLRGNTPVTDGELNGTAGKRSWVEFATTAGPEIDSREQQKANTQTQIAQLTSINNQLNQQITDITANSNATKADKDAALAKIAELQAELTTAMDKLKEAQNAPQVPVTDDQAAQVVADKANPIVQFFINVFNKLRGK